MHQAPNPKAQQHIELTSSWPHWKLTTGMWYKMEHLLDKKNIVVVWDWRARHVFSITSIIAEWARETRQSPNVNQIHPVAHNDDEDKAFESHPSPYSGNTISIGRGILGLLLHPHNTERDSRNCTWILLTAYERSSYKNTKKSRLPHYRASILITDSISSHHWQAIRSRSVDPDYWSIFRLLYWVHIF